jgi:hypothetical protein
MAHGTKTAGHLSAADSTPKGVRLPKWLWAAIDAEAAALQMTRNEILFLRLRQVFPVPADVQSKPAVVLNANTIDMELV